MLLDKILIHSDLELSKLGLEVLELRSSAVDALQYISIFDAHEDVAPV